MMQNMFLDRSNRDLQYNISLNLDEKVTSKFVKDNVIHMSMKVNRKLLEEIYMHPWTMVLEVDIDPK